MSYMDIVKMGLSALENYQKKQASIGIQIQDFEQETTILLHGDTENELNEGVYTGTELLNRNIDSLPCLLDPILPKTGLAGLGGSSDVGKSCFLRQLATAVATGQSDFLGFPLNLTHNSCIYVTTEDDEMAISFLLSKANKSKSRPASDYSSLKFIFDTTNLLEKIEYQISLSPVDLIIIDAFADMYGKSMNDSNQVRTFLNEYSQIAQKYKCLVIFLHHTGKGKEDFIPSKNNLLGSQGFEAKMRTVIELKLDQNEADKRHLCIVKANYLPREFKTKSFVLHFDENLQFSMTGERKDFEELKASSNAEKISKVKKLKEEGKTQKKISDELKIAQSSVSRYLKY
jgi:RecA-family ATPase